MFWKTTRVGSRWYRCHLPVKSTTSSPILEGTQVQHSMSKGTKKAPLTANRIEVPQQVKPDTIPLLRAHSCQGVKYEGETDQGLKYIPQSPCPESMSSWLIWLREMEKHLEDDMARGRRSVCSKSQRSARVHTGLSINTRTRAEGNPAWLFPAQLHGTHQKPLSPPPPGAWHAGGSLPTHAGQRELQQYD